MIFQLLGKEQRVVLPVKGSLASRHSLCSNSLIRPSLLSTEDGFPQLPSTCHHDWMARWTMAGLPRFILLRHGNCSPALGSAKPGSERQLSQEVDKPLKAVLRSLSLSCFSLNTVPKVAEAQARPASWSCISQEAVCHTAPLGGVPHTAPSCSAPRNVIYRPYAVSPRSVLPVACGDLGSIPTRRPYAISPPLSVPTVFFLTYLKINNNYLFLLLLQASGKDSVLDQALSQAPGAIKT